MKIGLLWESSDCGMYATSDFDTLYRKIGHNNGNLAFVHAVRTQIEGEILHFPWHSQASVLNESCDVVVIPCANQLGRHTDLGGLAKLLKDVTLPVIAIGLGAQAKEFGADVELSDGTRAWLDELIANGARHGIQNIYTRGPYTTQQIARLTGADTLAGGCPSHFMNPDPDLGRRIAANWESAPLPRRIAVAGGHESWRETRRIEQQLIALMMDPMFPGCYIVQSMGAMIRISRGEFDEIEPDKLDRIHQHTVPHYTHSEFRQWALNYARSYYDVTAWMDELRRHDLLIGPRFHGAQLAIQAERMACTVTIDTRTEEMCCETGVPFLRASELTFPITRTSLKEAIRFDGAAHDEHRAKKAARYVSFLTQAGLKPKAYLLDLATAARPPVADPAE
ncbi:polysaccharide pyruvyl transferase family protein [Paracoccus bogoriensis]|uniref:polysaccharide pyruvyl transferase family protein n=1 Tax=Paracoccus bogoriensis TaxID=242065 RepID=UPI001C674098|nr:polysaccharide pyruvyl transferase family protein [Paracoccus bogoriensis]MBW7057218.1 polysaccharide pyruvyl transferase family protein [Paracoccus bogoriensis]